MKNSLDLLLVCAAFSILCSCSSTKTVKAPTPLPGGHARFVQASPDTEKKLMRQMALRNPTQPPMPPLPEAAEIPPPHTYPHKPRARTAIPDSDAAQQQARKMQKQQVQVQSMLTQKAKAIGTGILYPFDVETVGESIHHCFDVPDDWQSWIIQKRGPEEDTWSECGRSVAEPTRGCRINSTSGFQYRLVRTSP